MEESGPKYVFATSDRKKHSVLIVDSDTQNLLYLSMLLQRFDFQTATAKTAREAFVSATTTIPSLIITALNLKDLSGLNLIKLLGKNPKTTNIPFIALRNQEDAVEEQYCFSAGAVDCLVKPVSAELLYRAVQGVFREDSGRVGRQDAGDHAHPDDPTREGRHHPVRRS